MENSNPNLCLHQGLVEDVKDPLKNGRVKVRVFLYDGTLEDELKTTEDLRWSKVLEPFAGYNKKEARGYGHFFRPKVGDSVWVQCEAGDPLQRVVMGSPYRYLNSGDPTVPSGFRIIPPFEEDETDVKEPIEEGVEAEPEGAYGADDEEPIHYQIKTPGGHTIAINESEDKEQVYIRTSLGHTLCFSDEPENEFVLLQDSHKNYIYFDTDNDDLHIFAKNNIKMTAGNDLRLHVNTNFELKVKGYWHAVIDGVLTFQSKTLSLMNSKTKALVSNWLWTGSSHTRDGKTKDTGGSHSHG